MTEILITGATSGLGLELAKNLAAAGADLVVGARSPDKADDLKAAVPASQLKLLPLDLASRASVRAFAEALKDQTFDAVALNAGLQFTGPQPLNEDGVCLSFATNHLGHFLLAHLLLPQIKTGGVVVSTCSGTHHPDEKLANLFGFRGGLFPSAARIAVGDLSDEEVSDAQQGMDLYATSKLCNILFMREMAGRVPATAVRFVGFDPGLMAGTGLARERAGMEAFGWKYVLPALQPLISLFGVRMSTPRKSAATLTKLLLDQAGAVPSGAYKDFALRPADISDAAQSAEKAVDLYDVSCRLSGVSAIQGVQ